MQYAKPVTLNVEECDRLSFLPYLFGQDFLYAEASVYALAKKMMPEYQGGFWHFIRLPDGGGYMMPDGDRFHMVNGENWFDRSRPCDDSADCWSGVVCREILTPFLARRFFPGILRLSSGCAGRSGTVTGVVSLAARG